MTWLALLRSPLVWALGAALAAVTMFWLWQGAREENAALRSSQRAYEEAAKITTRFLDEERQRTADLILALEELADVPDTTVCVDSPAIRALPGLLRRERADP